MAHHHDGQPRRGARRLTARHGGKVESFPQGTLTPPFPLAKINILPDNTPAMQTTPTTPRTLTEEQQRAVALQPADGKPAVIIAGAGAGKTAVMVTRILQDQMTGTKPGEQMVCTFTNAAAGEIRDRLGIAAAGLYHLGTIHSLAMRELAASDRRRHGKGSLTVLSDAALDAEIRTALKAMRINTPVETIRRYLSGAAPEPKMGNDAMACAALRAVFSRQRQTHPDLMLRALTGLADVIPLPKGLRIYADEMQDSNPAEWELYQAFRHCTDGQILVVGDPRQSIYGFRGAAPERLSRAWDATPQRAELTSNFRSRQPIVEAANKIAAKMTDLPLGMQVTMQAAIPDSPDAYVATPARFDTTEQEGAWIADMVADPTSDLGRAIREGDSLAILTRYNATAALIRQMLTGAGIRVVADRGPSPELREAAMRIAAERTDPDQWRQTLLRHGVRMAEQDAILAGPVDWAGLATEKQPESAVAAVGEGTVRVLTIHGSKGLEFDHVHIAGADHRAIGTENDDLRLAYVAVTRARLGVGFSYAESRPTEAGNRQFGLTASAVLGLL